MRMRRLAAALALGAAACAPRGPAPVAEARGDWVGTWAAAQQLTEPRNLPPAPGLTGNTLRQVAQVSIGGSRLRVRLSNRFGNGPLTVAAARIAASAGASAIAPGTERALTFGGRAEITLAAGGEAVSDVVDFALEPLSRVAVTLRFGAVPSDVTGHPGSRTTSYLVLGDSVGSAELDGATRTDHWYVLAGIDVEAEDAGAVVVIGNSITDGRGSGTNRQNRWPDHLARRLRDDPRTARVAVLNAGIGGNKVLRGGLGPPALERFDRDVLGASGVRWLIVLEGVNDLGEARGPAEAQATAQGLIDAYRWMVERAHTRGIRVYGATILPFGGSFYDAPEREAARQTVNRWIREGGAFDAVIDLDAALRDPTHPTRLRPEADTGDHLHPNETGHRMMGEAVDLALFARR
jgi:lysophospholipase L1-like esterase